MSTSTPVISAPQAAEVANARRERKMARAEWGVLGALGAWVAVLLFLEWPALLYPAFVSNSSIDSAFFSFAGELLRNGGTPYVSYWDHKPPLIHLINAAALTLSSGHVWGVWFASLAALLGAVWLAYQALRRSFGVVGATLGTIYFAFSVAGTLSFNLTEWYALPLQWATVLLFVKWWPESGKAHMVGFGIGVLAALGFLLRANLIGAAMSAGLVLSILLLSQRRMGAWFRLAVGAIGGAMLVGAVLVVYLGLAGSLDAFWEQAFRYNYVYAATTWKQRVGAAHQGLEWITVYGSLVLPLAGWILGVYRLGKHSHRDPLYPVFLFAVVWFPIELLLASTSGREYGHYFTTVYPPLSLLTALLSWELVAGNSDLLPGTSWLRARPTMLALSMAIAIPAVVGTAKRVASKGLQRERMDQISPTVEYIHKHSGANDKIFVWGHAADVYFFSGRKPASRFIYTLPLLTPAYADSALIQGFMDEIRTAAPSLIIDALGNKYAAEDLTPSLDKWDPEWRYPDPRREVWQHESWWTMTPALKEFYEFVAENYTLVDRIGPMKWRVYRRSASASAPRSP
jgi:4-amino-4-deoxy-L-arabinose transferase-like glycosyltransferase